MIINQLTLSDNLQERPVNQGKAFPLSTRYVDLGKWRTPSVPWHWHSEPEFLCLLRGSLKIFTAHQEYILSEGDGCFVNCNVLHRMSRLPKTQAVFLAQHWDVSLLGGVRGSIFEQKYLNPVLECKELEALPFLLQNANQRRILEHIRTSCDAVDSEEDGYEMIARNELSSAWLLMRKEIPREARQRQNSENPAEARVKRMMLYIREHYQEKLSLEEIADAANISTRECLRDFRQYLHTTPFSYLIDHRLNAAADSLLASGLPVTEIAMNCGFSSGSYFTKLFREKFQITPLEYRKANADPNMKSGRDFLHLED